MNGTSAELLTDSPQSPELGEVLDDKYLLCDRLGAGGMGVVYLARDCRLDREVAIKVVRPRLADDPELHRRLAEEARHMAKLRHPNVMEIYDIGKVDGCPYLVMPYCPGMNLSRWAQEQQDMPVSPAVVIGVLGQACAGVAALHDIGVVHHDIKPGNILISPSGEVVIADLGLAQRISTRLPTDDLSGTLGFLAPEHLRHEMVPEHLGNRADVYALGVTAYWLLTGRMPTGEGDFNTIAHKQLEAEILPPSELNPTLPPIFDEPIMRAMERDPNHRPDTLEFRGGLFVARDLFNRSQVDRKLFIVVVDDDPISLELSQAIIHDISCNAEVVATTNPRSALSIIESRPPDLVVTDLEMPELNGVELVASMRGNESTRDIPIIMLTGVGGPKEWSLLRNIGVERFLLKPVEPDTLHDVIVRVLEKYD